MITKLSHLADINIGQSIRDKIENILDGDFFIVQMKDVEKNSGVNKKTLYRTNIKVRTEPRFLKKGDLLFVPRVFRESLPFSVIVDVDLPNLIVSPAFYVISVNQKLIRTEYLHWFINSEIHGGKFFRRYAIGSSILNIPKNVLIDMEIIVPPIEEQDKFIKILKATKLEKILFEALLQKRVAFLDEAINKYL